MRIDPFQKFVYRPGLVAPFDSLVIGGELAVVRDTGAMLQQLARRVGLVGQGLVKLQTTLGNELKRARRKHSFGDAPPSK